MASRYDEIYRRSLADPEGFWGDAAQAIGWEKRWDTVLDRSRPPFYRWFTGGVLNTCWNALDRHVEGGRADQVAGVTSTIFVFVWVGALGSFAALLVSPSLFPDRHGIAFLLAAVVVTVACDVGSLLVGSAWGRHPMAPLVSPNKTWEGFIGGALAAIVVAVVVVHFVHPWTISKALVLGVVVAVVAPLGDLSQSMIKRQLGLKDMGRLMPGHGGLLDRVDGLLFVLPATYFVVKAMHLG